MKIYATKDLKTGNYWNRVHKDFRPLCQNTAFYKTFNEAESEIHPLKITWRKRDLIKDMNIATVILSISEEQK